MKIGIQTWGSNGDIRPLLALADGLQKQGHQVTLVVSSIDNQSYQPICEQLGLAYRQVPEVVNFDMQGFAQRSFKMNGLQWLKALLNEAFFIYEADIYAAAQQLVAENDFVIGHHFLYPLKLAALQQHKPFISVMFCHVAVPNSAVPPINFPDLGTYVNKVSWALLDIAINWTLKKPLTRLWLAVGAPPPKNILSELLCSQQLNLVAVDPLFCGHSELWSSNHQACGFLNLTEDTQQWSFPETLTDFLASGSKPVYMTFGSLQAAVPEWAMDLFVQAINLAGCRAIIQTSSVRYLANSQLDNIYFIGKHPHQKVFEYCAAVVHHGGAGTSHAATRSGCPSIVVPFMDEQHYWAKELQDLGLAGKPLPAKKVTPMTLAAGINTVLDSVIMTKKAQIAGMTMQADQGIEKALQLISELINYNL